MPTRNQITLSLALLAAASTQPAQGITTYDDPQRYEDWNAQHVLPQVPRADARLEIWEVPTDVYPCSGALLESGQHVLTAAHCLDWSPTTVRVSFNVPTAIPEIAVSPESVVVHQHWAGSVEQGVDLAIIRLPAPVASIEGYRLAPFGPMPAQTNVEIRGFGPSGQGALNDAYPFGTLRAGWNHYDGQRHPAELYVYDFDDYSDSHNEVGEPGWITIYADPPFQSIIHIDHEFDGTSVLGEVFPAKGDSGGATIEPELGLLGIHSGIATSQHDTNIVDLDGDGWSDDANGDGVPDTNASFGELGFDTPVYLHVAWIECVVGGGAGRCDADGDCDVDLGDRDFIIDTNGTAYGESAYRWGADFDEDQAVAPDDLEQWIFACGVCGDGTLGAGETCDDGNTSPGDGCDASCAIEDLDGDGVPDPADNCVEVANLDQRDTDHDGHGNACDPDLTNDGTVGIPDFNAFRALFGRRAGEPGFDENADFTGDGVIGIPDLNVLRAFFGGSPGPSGVP